MSASDLYEADILKWSEQQSRLLRRLAAGARVNDQVDWEHVVEESESVGHEQLHAVSALLVQAMIDRLKAIGWPHARSAVPARMDGNALLPLPIECPWSLDELLSNGAG